MIYFIMILILLFIALHVFLFFIFHTPPSITRLTYDTCIVLGCPTRMDGKLSRMQKSRMDKAIELYQHKTTKTILISGASVRNEFLEAQVMADYARKKKVAKADIFLEVDALNTYANIKNSARICAQQKWEHIIVVTSRFHSRRANFFVRKFFTSYALATPLDKEKFKHYAAEYIRMWNSLRIELMLKLKKAD